MSYSPDSSLTLLEAVGDAQAHLVAGCLLYAERPSVGTAHCVPPSWAVETWMRHASGSSVVIYRRDADDLAAHAHHGEGTVAAVEIEVAPAGHCHDLTTPGSRRSRVHPST